MSGAAGVEETYSSIEESSRLLDVPCSRDNVLPILTTFRESLPEAVIVNSMATGKRHAGELDYSFTIPAPHGDPYVKALANGLVEATDHPVGTLLADVQEHCSTGGFAVDCGVVAGFQKAWLFFALDDLPGLTRLSDIPSMPRSLAENADFFSSRGLDDKVTMIGIDYQSKTINLYFGRFAPEILEPKSVIAMLRDLGLPEPSQEVLEFAQQSFSIYVTLSWDSSKIDRICFAVITPDAAALPSRLHPDVAKFATNAPFAYDGHRILVYGVTFSPRGEYYKVGAYYQMTDQTRKLLVAFDAIK